MARALPIILAGLVSMVVATLPSSRAAAEEGRVPVVRLTLKSSQQLASTSPLMHAMYTREG